MPALPVPDGVKAFPIDLLNTHSFAKRYCCDTCDCDDVDPAIPVAIVVVVVVLIVIVLGIFFYRRRRNGGGANSGGRRGIGGFGLMSSAWRALSSRGGDQSAAQSSQAWPGATTTLQTQPSHTEMTTEPRPRPQHEGVWRPQSKTLSQLPPPPQYVESDPNPDATEDGLARMRSFNRSDETSERSATQSPGPSQSQSPSPPERQRSNESSSSGSPAPGFGRTRGTNVQRMGGQGRVSMLPQRPEYD